MPFVVGRRCVARSIFAVSSHFIGYWKLPIDVVISVCTLRLFIWIYVIRKKNFDGKQKEVRWTSNWKERRFVSIGWIRKKRHHGSHRVFEYHDHSKSRCSSQITASHCSSIRSIYKLRQKRGAARLTDGKATKIETKEKNQIAEIFCYWCDVDVRLMVLQFHFRLPVSVGWNIEL